MRGSRKGVGGRGLIVDTNILLLFLVGSLDLKLIAKHKRVNQFTVQDFHLLDQLLRRFGAILTTPNVLTEVTNLAMQIGGAAKERLVTLLAALLQKGAFEEHVAESKEASKVKEFRRLGLTDAGIIHLTRKEWTVLTDDLHLYLALQGRGLEAINFHQLRGRMWKQRR